ncbi:ABC transporter, ATP-binding protein [Metamycoplasma cloacale]|uniref:ABC transporter ATP-binding protein n=1 Tax=Metamycoplasma cloacale TaxID=92401 RepID=A0A2Z4LM64_9BACT|nr:ABC transporter ATP-binding protein [Metamycoplasma cloacale]AWX42800.1 ABC transporter ATP-binding protein [Metamycoplasma cloacale]VEU79381.1 ABC transporter, ATP-binding protein [Metamycoplasma cloacale]
MENKVYAIEIKNLVKNFKNVTAINNLSFSVEKGQLFGFLGLNGAGKTTTLNIILGLLKRTSGEIFINGENFERNVANTRKQIGIVFQESILDASLTVKQNLMTRAYLYVSDFEKNIKVKDIVEEIIKEFQLEEIANREYGKLSGGQKRRVDIARALVHKPSILFLDEPTTGLDPSSRKLVWSILRKIQKERKLTILLTTHYMEEANNCDYSIIIEKGNKLAEGSPTTLKTKYASAMVKVYNNPNIINHAIKAKGFHAITHAIDGIEIRFKTYQMALNFVKNHIELLNDYEIVKGDMDEVFLNVTGAFKNKKEGI